MMNDQSDLRVFDDARFDMLYSAITLQHVPSRQAIESYIAEFVRILKEDGLLIFQRPSRISPYYMRRWRMKLYSLLRTLGVPCTILYKRLGLYPIRMNFIPTDEVVSLLESCHATVLEIEDDTLAPPHDSHAYYVTK